MTEAEFDQMYAESLERLDAYIATQVTESQIFHARQSKRHVERNRDYFKPLALKGELLYLCKHCGSMEAATFVEPTKTRMVEAQRCFGCDHWEQVASKSDARRLVIDGQTYSDGGNQPNAARKDWLGFGGAVHHIERDGKVWTTNNLWSGGTIPQEFRDRLPDNARFVSKAAA